jgi:signal transduction histidine kinase/DNA-binding response OmpR family regulator
MRLHYIFILYGYLFTFGQEYQTSIDTLEAKKMYKIMMNQANLTSSDTNCKRAHIILKTINLKNNETNYKSLIVIRDNSWLVLLRMHGAKAAIDSSKYYSNLITKFTKNPEILAKTNYVTGYLELNNLNYGKGLELVDKALQYYKEIGDHDQQILILLQIVNFYLEAESIEYAKDIMTILNSKNESDFSPRHKFLFGIIKSRLLMLENEEQASLDYLIKLDTALFKELPPFKRIYFSRLSKTNSLMGNYDLAISNIHKAYPAKKNKINARDAAAKNSILAENYYQKKDYKKALFYFKELEGLEHIRIPTKLKNSKTKYFVYKKIGDLVKATIEIENYLELNDSIRQVEGKKQTSILNYNLKKDEELSRLQALHIQQQYDSRQKNQKLIFGGVILFILLIMLGIFIYFYLEQKNLKTKIALRYNKKVSALKNNFIENLSHEFRTPIAVIIGYLDLIKSRNLQPNQVAAYADIGIKNGNELISTLNDFLTVLRNQNINHLQEVQNLSSKNMLKFIFTNIESFLGIAELHKIKLYFKSNIRDNDTNISFDYDKLEKVLNNLITNAIKFSKLGGSVYITANLEKDFFYLRVEDEGVGIPKKEQKKVFNRFYQSGKHTNQGGFGIGLSLVKNLISTWNGEITLQSKEDVGTVFEVRIPLKTEGTDLYTHEEKSDFTAINIKFKEIAQEKKTSNLPKALILEDNKDMGLFTAEVLSSIVSSTIVYNGQDGLYKLKEEKFDIIISDLRMPVLDGFEFKAALNKLDDFKDIPYLMLTSSPIDYKNKERTSLGITEYIIKPFHDIEIIARVQLLLKTKINKENLFNLQGDALDFEGDCYKLMNNINTIILDNLQNSEFNVEQLSQLSNFSKSKLYKEVHSKTGLSPVKIILELRLLKAYELIKTHRFETLNEVMTEIGISSAPYFRKVFLKRFGIKPGNMVKQITGTS